MNCEICRDRPVEHNQCLICFAFICTSCSSYVHRKYNKKFNLFLEEHYSNNKLGHMRPNKDLTIWEVYNRLMPCDEYVICNQNIPNSRCDMSLEYFFLFTKEKLFPRKWLEVNPLNKDYNDTAGFDNSDSMDLDESESESDDSSETIEMSCIRCSEIVHVPWGFEYPVICDSCKEIGRTVKKMIKKFVDHDKLEYTSLSELEYYIDNRIKFDPSSNMTCYSFFQKIYPACHAFDTGSCPGCKHTSKIFTVFCKVCNTDLSVSINLDCISCKVSRLIAENFRHFFPSLTDEECIKLANQKYFVNEKKKAGFLKFNPSTNIEEYINYQMKQLSKKDYLFGMLVKWLHPIF